MVKVENPLTTACYHCQLKG